jgi:peptidoglycan hydrolase CwlO-like protein
MSIEKIDKSFDLVVSEAKLISNEQKEVALEKCKVIEELLITSSKELEVLNNVYIALHDILEKNLCEYNVQESKLISKKQEYENKEETLQSELEGLKATEISIRQQEENYEREIQKERDHIASEKDKQTAGWTSFLGPVAWLTNSIITNDWNNMIPGYSLAQCVESLVMHKIETIENQISELKVIMQNLEYKLKDTENQKTNCSKNIENIKNDINVLSEKIKKTEAMVTTCGK